MKATDNLNDLLKDFRKVANLASVELPSNAMVVDTLPAPHKQTPLPEDRFAVYVFNWTGTCLKVGKVGSRSQSRFTSQHYNPNSSASNLAKSILSHQEEL